MEFPLPVPGATQHLTAQLGDTSSCPPGTQSLLEQGICFKVRGLGTGRPEGKGLASEGR